MPTESFIEAILNAGKSLQDNGDIAIEKSAFYSEILKWIQYFDSCPDALCYIIPVAFIFDYRTASVVYISPSVHNLLGYNYKDMLGDNSLFRFIDLMHPNDFKVYNEQIFPKEVGYLHDGPVEHAKDIIFSNTFRIKHANGNYKTLLVKKCYLLDEENQHPFNEFGILMDISALKKELSITHTIERFVKGREHSSFMKVVSEDYFPEMDAGILSAREKEILINLSLGIKRKDVGKMLFISDNTVANHIKTILRKTNTKNIRAAIAKCKMNGII